jgi:hypothetical protein
MKEAAMNEIFSFRRFIRLFVKHTVEHYRAYLMSIAVLAGVLLLGGSFVFYMSIDPPDVGFQSAIFVLLMVIAGTLFTSTVFSDLGEKSKAIPALTLPATALEKYLVAWLYAYPIFLIVYTGIFYLALYGLSRGRHWDDKQHFYILDLRHSGMVGILIVFSVMQALALFGSVFFRKLHFIKAGFAFFIGSGIAILCNTLLLKIMTGLREVDLAIPYSFLDFSLNDRNYRVGPVDPDWVLVLSLMALTAVMIWVAAYFRLKEKQV